jgi:hypothetical protein
VPGSPTAPLLAHPQGEWPATRLPRSSRSLSATSGAAGGFKLPDLGLFDHYLVSALPVLTYLTAYCLAQWRGGEVRLGWERVHLWATNRSALALKTGRLSASRDFTPTFFFHDPRDISGVVGGYGAGAAAFCSRLRGSGCAMVVSGDGRTHGDAGSGSGSLVGCRVAKAFGRTRKQIRIDVQRCRAGLRGIPAALRGAGIPRAAGGVGSYTRRQCIPPANLPPGLSRTCFPSPPLAGRSTPLYA